MGGVDLRPDLLHVDPDEGEDEATVHDAEQVVEEESQAGVQTLGNLKIEVQCNKLMRFFGEKQFQPSLTLQGKAENKHCLR